MPNRKPTEHALRLAEALRERGVELELEHYDRHKHVDIYIPAARLYIEVDGVPHNINPEQLISDFNRDYFSFKENFFTKHITNEALDIHLEKIADAIAYVVKNGPSHMGENLLK